MGLWVSSVEIYVVFCCRDSVRRKTEGLLHLRPDLRVVIGRSVELQLFCINVMWWRVTDALHDSPCLGQGAGGGGGGIPVLKLLHGEAVDEVGRTISLEVNYGTHAPAPLSPFYGRSCQKVKEREREREYSSHRLHVCVFLLCLTCDSSEGCSRFGRKKW